MRTVEVGGLSIGRGHQPVIMGVVNLSEQSPYSPSVFEDPEEAANHIDDSLIGEGAQIVDIGLESANKRFDVRSADWELDRLNLAFETVDRVESEAVFSIETRYHEVAARALEGAFDMVNDICGFADPELPAVCERHDVPVVKMASPPDLDRPGALATVDDIYNALAREPLTDKTIIDPAFGGWSEEKTLATDRETFRQLTEFSALGRPILVSINRKNFLRKLVGRTTGDALPVSLAATSMAVERGADVIRTHDVAETRDAARIGHAFRTDPPQDERIIEFDFSTVSEAERVLDRLGMERTIARRCLSRALLVTPEGDHDRSLIARTARDAGLAVSTAPTGIFVAGRPDAIDQFVTAWDRKRVDEP